MQLDTKRFDFDVWMEQNLDTTLFHGIENMPRVLKGLMKLERMIVSICDDAADESGEQQALVKAKHEFEQGCSTSQDLKIVVERLERVM